METRRRNRRSAGDKAKEDQLESWQKVRDSSDEEIDEDEAFGSEDEKSFGKFFQSKPEKMVVSAEQVLYEGDDEDDGEDVTEAEEDHESEVQKPFVVRHFPNFLTSITVACGMVIMLSGTLLEKEYAVVALLVGLVTDILDGIAARKLQVKTLIGANFDQLADLTAFGISPAVYFMQTRSNFDNVPVFASVACGVGYMVAAVYRIARELSVHRGNRPLFFVGIPTNLAAFIFVPAVNFAAEREELQVALHLLCAVLVFFMISTIHVPKGLGIIQVK